MITIAKPVIICIVGPSGSGKTTLSRHLQDKMGIRAVVSCTTRPMRKGEENGKDHWFLTEKEMPEPDQMLAYTQFGGHHYWVPLWEIKCCEVCSYVIDEKGVRCLEERFGDLFYLVKVLIDRPIEALVSQVGEERVMRDLEREAIPREEYDLILRNDSSLEEFLDSAIEEFKKMLD